MTKQLDIFTRYPSAPGHQKTDTSKAGAKAAKPSASTLRELCLAELRKKQRTADEVAAALGQSVLSIRPRFTELKVRGEIEDTGVRRRNESGVNAIVWRVK